MSALGTNPYKLRALGPYGLSLTEMEVLQTLADWEFDSKVVRDILNISMSTLKRHLHNIFSKTYTNRLAEAYALGIREGFIK